MTFVCDGSENNTKSIRKEIAESPYSDAIAKEVELVKQCTSDYILKYYNVTRTESGITVPVSTLFNV